jgi:hypothetical protein
VTSSENGVGVEEGEMNRVGGPRCLHNGLGYAGLMRMLAEL